MLRLNKSVDLMTSCVQLLVTLFLLGIAELSPLVLIGLFEHAGSKCAYTYGDSPATLTKIFAFKSFMSRMFMSRIVPTYFYNCLGAYGLYTCIYIRSVIPYQQLSCTYYGINQVCFDDTSVVLDM